MMFDFTPLINIIYGFLVVTWIVILFSCLISKILQGQWRRTIYIIILPIIAVLLLQMLQWSNITPERLRLEYNITEYRKEITKLQTEGEAPYLKTWRWGETSAFPAGINDYILLYDDSDQIMLPYQARTDVWKQRFVLTKHSESLISNAQSWNEHIIVQPLGKHFYLLIRMWSQW